MILGLVSEMNALAFDLGSIPSTAATWSGPGASEGRRGTDRLGCGLFADPADPALSRDAGLVVCTC